MHFYDVQRITILGDTWVPNNYVFQSDGVKRNDLRIIILTFCATVDF